MPKVTIIILTHLKVSIMKMERIFHPIGHGAFYTERFYENNFDKPSFTVVYDCGSKTPSILQNEIDITFRNYDVIDLFFVSHFHNDHICGVEYLLKSKQCTIGRFVIPVITEDIFIEAYLYNYIKTSDSHCFANEFLTRCYNGGNDDKLVTVDSFEDSRNGQIINFRNLEVNDIVSATGVVEIHNPTRVKKDNWLYIPYNVNNNRAKLISAIKAHPDFQGVVVDGVVDSELLSNKLNSLGLDRCTNIYEEIFGEYHNKYSMPVFSGIDCSSVGKCYKECHKHGDFPSFCHTNCLYMGDYDAKNQDNYNALAKFYEHYWDRIGLIQVPHHGSKFNSDEKLYKPKKFCIISAKNCSSKHPDQMTINSIRSTGSIHMIVTEDKRTEQKFIYKLND